MNFYGDTVQSIKFRKAIYSFEVYVINCNLEITIYPKSLFTNLTLSIIHPYTHAHTLIPTTLRHIDIPAYLTGAWIALVYVVSISEFYFKKYVLGHTTWYTGFSSPIMALALEALSCNHWITKEVSISEFYSSVSENHNAWLVIDNLFFQNKVFFILQIWLDDNNHYFHLI